MVALLVLRIWLAGLLARYQGFAVCWGPLENYSACVAEFLQCVARRGDLFVWRASNTDNASVRKTVVEHGS